MTDESDPPIRPFAVGGHSKETSILSVEPLSINSVLIAA